MLVKLLSIITLANEHGPEVDQGELLRYLAEIVWFPTAWLSDYIQWEAIDAQSAKATIILPNNTVAAVLHFNEKGQMTERGT